MNRIIYIITQNFKLVYKLHKILGKKYQIIHLIEPINGATQDIIVTDYNNKLRGSNVIGIHPDMDELEIKKVVIGFLHKRTNGWETIIGIDPGHTIGLALLFRNRVLNTNVVYTIEGVVTWIKKSLRTIHITNFIIKIGDGGEVIRDALILRLQREFGSDSEIEIVDEHNTSIRISSTRTRHEEAAILIARRKGKPLEME